MCSLFQLAFFLFEIGEACKFPAFKILEDLHFFPVQFERGFHLKYSFVAFRLGMMVFRNRVAFLLHVWDSIHIPFHVQHDDPLIRIAGLIGMFVSSSLRISVTAAFRDAGSRNG